MDRFWGSTSIMLSLSLLFPLSPLLTLHFLILILAMCRTVPLRLLTLEQAAWACDFSFPLQFSANEKVPCSVLSTLNTSPPPFRVCIAAGISEVFRILSGLHSVAKGSYLSPWKFQGCLELIPIICLLFPIFSFFSWDPETQEQKLTLTMPGYSEKR